MGQYYMPYTKNEKEEMVWGQSRLFEETRDYGHYVGVKLMEHSYYGTKIMNAVSDYIFKNPTKVAWLGDYSDEFTSGRFNGVKEHNHECVDFDPSGLWLVNHDKMEAVQMCNDNPNLWIIHPLSLLTACGNGRGGGDYWGKGEEFVGMWAFDTISIENYRPYGFIEIDSPFRVFEV